LLERSSRPDPWAEGDNLPWHEPGFSARMLAEHLSDAHDAASRRAGKIDAHVAWLAGAFLTAGPARVLDLGCGPGLYCERLARLGHHCTGVDWSPASINHAVTRAREASLRCDYRCADLRGGDFGRDFALVLLISGELNVFRPEQARELVHRVRQALAPSGALVLEVHTLASLESFAGRAPRWRVLRAGLFSERPHLWLEEFFWHPAERAATRRHFVVDLETQEVTRYASSLQAYADVDYEGLLREAGFAAVEGYASLIGAADPSQPDFNVYVGRVAPGSSSGT
jgi:SAM-dependent methyltransferase